MNKGKARGRLRVAGILTLLVVAAFLLLWAAWEQAFFPTAYESRLAAIHGIGGFFALLGAVLAALALFVGRFCSETARTRWRTTATIALILAVVAVLAAMATYTWVVLASSSGGG